VPFELFDTCRDVSNTFQKAPPKTGKNCVQPVFYEPGIVYLGGASAPPALGIAFGTGDRSLTRRLRATAHSSELREERLLLRHRRRLDRDHDGQERPDQPDAGALPSNPCQPYDPAVCGLRASFSTTRRAGEDDDDGLLDPGQLSV
jgi:hypothetical protein